MQTESRRRFLTARWLHLVMLNYPVERELLDPLVPNGTVLDTYQGKPYVSIVGFLFLDTRVLGVAVPMHRDFEELNLRFYVRRFDGNGWRRGVVFIKEIVPRPAIAAVARVVYNENYVAAPMRHRIETSPEGSSTQLEYGWQVANQWNTLRASTTGTPRHPAPGSIEEFITEHYWGYVRQRDGRTVEYQVEHPRWRIWTAAAAALDCDLTALYGEAFARVLNAPPASAFVAEGSAVTVFRGVHL